MNALAQNMHNYFPHNRHILGLIVVVIGSFVCLWVNMSLDTWSDGRIIGLSSLSLAILLGMILSNTLYPNFSEQLSDGVNFAKGQILRPAIIFYGFKLTLTQ